MQEQTLIVNLSMPLEYSVGGDFEITHSLEIEPPGPASYELAMALAQKVARAMFEAQKLIAPPEDAGDTAETQTEITAEAAKLLILSSTIPISEFTVPLVRLLEQTCTMDGKTRMKSALFDRLPVIDKNELLFKYVSNFSYPLIF